MFNNPIIFVKHSSLLRVANHLVYLMLIWILCSCNKHESTPEEVVAETATTVQKQREPEIKYGLVVDSLTEVNGKIKWNQSLAEILTNYQVSHERVYQIAAAAKGVFDVRKLKAGNPYSLFLSTDSISRARYFVFEPDRSEYVVFDLDSTKVTRTKRPSRIMEQTIVAEITSSVYEAVLRQEASPLLVNKLVDVFAWQVDFFRIQKGDQFKVIYDVEEVNGEVVEIKNIRGAYFKHFGKDYYAIRFENGGTANYFDEMGNSLRKTFLRAPLNYSRISSRYNPRRFHPVLKRYKAHLGTDYAAPTGTPIRTVGDGKVLEAKYSKGNGNYVKIRHNSNYTTQYLHMSKIAKGIRPGVKVKQGQTIGYVGSTGLANGPHLCFRFWKNGRQVDALKVDLPPSEPVSIDKKSNFLHVKNVMLNQLVNLDFSTDTLRVSTVADLNE